MTEVQIWWKCYIFSGEFPDNYKKQVNFVKNNTTLRGKLVRGSLQASTREKEEEEKVLNIGHMCDICNSCHICAKFSTFAILVEVCSKANIWQQSVNIFFNLVSFG